MIPQSDMYVDGKAMKPASGRYFESSNPHDGSVVALIAEGGEADVEAAVSAASKAQRAWAQLHPQARGKILRKLAELITINAASLAKLDSDEMGMPSKIAAGVALEAASYFEYYGGLTSVVQGDTIPTTPQVFSYNLYEPYGIVGVITPWNAPVNQAARSIAPALATGNAVVHKPSEFTSLSAVELARLAVEAGVPPGVYNVVTGDGTHVGEPLVRHPLIRKVAFTGSLATGQKIGTIAAQKVMPLTLELGGKSPHIIFEDAKLEAALPMALFGFVANSGQICTSGSRILIQRKVYDRFSQMLAEAAARCAIGRDNPFPTLGPIANRMQFEKVLSYFECAKSEGAKCLIGGERARGEGLDSGYYIKPTIFADVTADMRIVREEIFGPVSVLLPFDSEEEAIEIANDTEFGLAAGLWTQDVSRAHRVAAQLQAGTVYVNTYHERMIEAPMGGYKKSGLGRERGINALYDYMQLKNVTMKLM